jgi:hypothetical protein
MSKFLTLCEKVHKLLNEDETTDPNAPVVDPNAAPAPAATPTPEPQLDQNAPSELPIVSNNQIAQMVLGLQKFIQDNKDKVNLTDEQKTEISSLLPRADDRSDEAIKSIVKTLISVFPIGSESTIDFKPQDIKPSED